MKKIIYALVLVSSFCLAQTIEESPINNSNENEAYLEENENVNSADCLILEDENSIICKYLHTRMPEDREIVIHWIDPVGEISRQRTLIIPAGHGSIYDFRYIEGRQKGIWQFKVIEGENETSTTFEIN